MTATSSGEEADLLSGPSTTPQPGASDFWEVIARTTTSVQRDVDSALISFARSLVGIPDVVAVTHAKERHANLVWTFIRRRDKGVRKAIYAMERALMADFPDLTFDFNVVALDQGTRGALVPDDLQGRMILYRPQE